MAKQRPQAFCCRARQLCCGQALVAWLVRVCYECCVRGEREDRSEMMRRASKDARP